MRLVTLIKRIVTITVVMVVLSSCAGKKRVHYFQDARNSETIMSKTSFVPKFKVDDEISIIVTTLNPEASIPFNLFRRIEGSGSVAGDESQINYLVDEKGFIDFPVLGKIRVVGLSPEELKQYLQKELAVYLKDPIINIRLRNFTVTILGAVAAPGTYRVIGEQITILEALGLAGDLSIKGIRENIMVIRDYNGTKVYNKIDLTSKQAMDSPVYYLTQNDVVYVEQNPSAVSEYSLDGRTSLTLSIVSLLVTTTLLLTR
ncbi:polysaccharide biosynthesis/export family protein [Lentiprolixibacter aurantiacus]|uniref:Polysaccharide biosynthesis/export family protein n=1 Tax=Lentiprolixibacter aurantiacus TaxID=2993939 RepID=A0AAE3MM11_9FLAO|nr:polysaccharide biosynthesis/export family protein [Lentiprolixibacter aurantiacus]MCX2719841.1 polysaccharide biosynthesis/export family protein [Lentiprolixibacter aurantiacus]